MLVLSFYRACQWMSHRLHFAAGDWLEVQEEGGSVKKGKSRHDLCNAGRPREWTTRGNVVTIRMSVATPGHGYNMTYSMLQAPPRPGLSLSLLSSIR